MLGVILISVSKLDIHMYHKFLESMEGCAMSTLAKCHGLDEGKRPPGMIEV